MRQIITLSALLLLILGSTACGFKGPLVPATPEQFAQQQLEQ